MHSKLLAMRVRGCQIFLLVSVFIFAKSRWVVWVPYLPLGHEFKNAQITTLIFKKGFQEESCSICSSEHGFVGSDLGPILKTWIFSKELISWVTGYLAFYGVKVRVLEGFFPPSFYQTLWVRWPRFDSLSPWLLSGAGIQVLKKVVFLWAAPKLCIRWLW